MQRDRDLERKGAAGPDVGAQVEYARDREWARTAEDVVRWRTTLEVRGLAGPAVRERNAATLAGTPVFNSADGR